MYKILLKLPLLGKNETLKQSNIVSRLVDIKDLIQQRECYVVVSVCAGYILSPAMGITKKMLN